MLEHPYTRREKRAKSDNDWRKDLERVYQQKWVQWTIYGLNLVCIIWTIISVELTLVWNHVSDVYTINSTGQLIPFVTAVIAFIKLMHAISVEQSKVRTTEILMGLLDPNGTPNDEPKPDNSEPDKWKKFSDERVYPLRDDDEAVFWNSKPYRRHSIQIITDALIDDDVEEPRRIPFHHLWNLDDHDTLVDIYGEDGIESYDCNGRLSVHIIKDFRKQLKTAYEVETDSETESETPDEEEDEASQIGGDDNENVSSNLSSHSAHSGSARSHTSQDASEGRRRC